MTGSMNTTCLASRSSPHYFLLLQKVVEFFKTGVSPIDVKETLAIISFLQAADKSKEREGKVVQVCG